MMSSERSSTIFKHGKGSPLPAGGDRRTTVTVYAPFLGDGAPPESPDDAHRAMLRLLARARYRALNRPDHHQRLWELFGQPATVDGSAPPFAAIMRVGDGIDAPGRYWLCAEPVSLQADMRALVLSDSRAFALSADEADSLIALLNSELGGAGWRLHRGRSTQRWYLAMDAPLDAVTVSARQAAARDVDASLPSGPAAMALRRMLNDVQMLLHEAPVNQARDRCGARPINGLWFWGGGAEPAWASAARPDWRLVLADDPLSVGLAARLGIAQRPWSFIADALAGDFRDGGSVLLVAVPESDTPDPPDAPVAAAGTVLRAALRRGTVARAVIETARGEWTLRRFDALRFWRPIRPFADHG